MATHARLITHTSSHFKIHAIAIGPRVVPNPDGSVTLTMQQFEAWTQNTITSGNNYVKLEREHEACNRKWKITLCLVTLACATAISGLAAAWMNCKEKG